MPSKPKPREKIVQARLAGATRAETALKLGVSVKTVDDVMRDARREGYLEEQIKAIEVRDRLGERGMSLLDWKEQIKSKSIVAVDVALECTDDKYKAGDLGVKCLKGLGEFTETHQGLHLLVATVPKDWVQKFPTADDSNNDAQG